jgi:long-chain acyl-CoA synthetase
MRLTAADSVPVQRRFAGGLRDRGLVTGDRVVLLVPSSTALVSAALGALRAGIVPVPLDPRLTLRERELLLADVEPALVVEDPAALDALATGPEADLAPWPLARPMHVTSGTTGRPKGVWSGILSTHDAKALAREEQDLWGFTATDCHLVLSPLHHSAPLRFASGTLLAGGDIVVPGPFDPAQALRVIEEHRPTTTFCVPAHLQRLFAAVDEQDPRPHLAGFRLVAHAGAPCPDDVRRRAMAEFGPEVVWEFYGSTEGQFTACAATEWERHPGTVGRARAGRRMLAHDGVLWCVVPEHARFTYWRAPEKTAAAWRQTDAGPAFTVGDLGRVDEDGYVYLEGRREDLIISGGVNVYPLEVEEALRAHPGVDEVAVFGVPDQRWGQRVCAAVVGSATAEELDVFARERLAPPKRPKEYFALGELPHTSTGKVRRLDLPHVVGATAPGRGDAPGQACENVRR